MVAPESQQLFPGIDLEKLKSLFNREREPISNSTLRSVQIPPPQSLGPRVEHMPIFTCGKLSRIIAEELAAPDWFVLELMRFGAVYYTPIIPTFNGSDQERQISEEKREALSIIQKAALNFHGPDPKLRVIKRTTQDIEAYPGSYARVHIHPKRFPAAYTTEWASRVILNTDQFVAVNKPRGVLVPPTVDNIIECTTSRVAKAIGFNGQLLNPHRLDRETEGVLFLAKTSRVANMFDTLMMQRNQGQQRIRKVYKALTSDKPPLGSLVHYLRVGQRKYGQAAHTHVFSEPVQGAVKCELVVQKVEQVQLIDELRQQWGGEAYESTVLLLTGRTHQIRAQLAHIGHPLLGDTLYSTLCNSDNSQIDLQRQRVSDDGNYALQAYQMTIQHDGQFEGCDNPLVLQAGVPWWRKQFEPVLQ